MTKFSVEEMEEREDIHAAFTENIICSKIQYTAKKQFRFALLLLVVVMMLLPCLVIPLLLERHSKEIVIHHFLGGISWR